MSRPRRVLAACAFVCMNVALGTANAGPNDTPAPAVAKAAPQGGAVEVPVHAGAVCILSFPEKLAPTALASSPDFEINSATRPMMVFERKCSVERPMRVGPPAPASPMSSPIAVHTQ